MDQHNSDILPSVELPSPQPIEQSPETSQMDIQPEKESSKQLEKAPVAPAAQNPQTLPQNIPAAPMITPHSEPDAGVVGIAVTPQIADDTDLIEKEWVDRAKRIVEHTRNDPHQQTKEMSAMKADYLKKRYNKDLKLSE
jgi:hypothetical protein